MSKKLVYYVEDEQDIAELVKFTLVKEGFLCEHFPDGRSFLDRLSKQKPDLVLLDLMLPDFSGFDLCSYLRTTFKLEELPIVMLTAKGDEQNVVRGFEVGADDYINKPFSPKVLVARLHNILKRMAKETPDESGWVENSGISIHKGKHEVKIEGKSLRLTKSEFSILYLLATHPGWVYSRSQIVDVIRGHNYSVTERTIDFQMVGLRKKLGQHGDLIETVRGIGYRFSDSKPASPNL